MTGDAVPTLRDKIALWPDQPVFAAMDGAGFSNLPRFLRDERIPFRPLFLDRRPGDVGRAGPFMAIVPRDRLETFLTLRDVPDGSVFWNAPCGADEFHRHLRSLTMVRIPSAPGKSPKTRMVVFRHFDPKTVVLTLPVMTPAQRARMFGPAQSLVVSVPEGVLEAKRRMDWPEPAKGPLSFTKEQMDAITDGMTLRSRRKIVAYLRETALEQTKKMDDTELLGFVEEAEKVGKAWGLKTEAGQGRLAWLQLMSEGRFAKQKAIERVIELKNDKADSVLKIFMEEMAQSRNEGLERQ
ncbi:MAG: DUF4123 domain-containing protein [Acetobacter aceti]|uniref:DUF4123 domain-containing protein n=1 Tax=Acetobacter aceti TaxID=435 RepID=A0A1U9KIE2_ACEAC|nr:DUF4123 domain-containing protein [Acetobacter aceti]AQS85526.1 hypothetical protein A0U92_12930 [Acetobacter aceti]